MTSSEPSGPPCYFCGAPAATTPGAVGSATGSFMHCSADIPDAAAPPYWHEPGADGRYRSIVALCATHEQALRAAGEAGHVDEATGIRWWLDG